MFIVLLSVTYVLMVVYWGIEPIFLNTPLDFILFVILGLISSIFGFFTCKRLMLLLKLKFNEYLIFLLSLSLSLLFLFFVSYNLINIVTRT